jgi:hypothetical protein
MTFFLKRFIESADQPEELLFFFPGQVNQMAVLHLILSSVATDIALDVLQVDDVGMVCAEKNILGQKFFKFLECPARQQPGALLEINGGIIALSFQVNVVADIEKKKAVKCWNSNLFATAGPGLGLRKGGWGDFMQIKRRKLHIYRKHISGTAPGNPMEN